MFERGVRLLGFEPHRGLPDRPATDRDLLITWNLIGTPAQRAAASFPGIVIVTENAAWGNGFAGRRWLTLALGAHNTAGRFPIGTNSRWDALRVELEPLRAAGGPTMILPQRGIGVPGTAMPYGWAERVQRRRGGHIRLHPGNRGTPELLREALRGVSRVITWGSGAGILAAAWGCEVVSEMPEWIGRHDFNLDDRLRMFRQLAWAQFEHDEIASGAAIGRLLEWYPQWRGQ